MLTPLEPRSHPAASDLFPPSFPNLAFIHAVLSGTIPGQVWAPREGGTARACLITTGSPFCFIGGERPHEILEEASRLLRQRPPITLVCPEGLDVTASAAAHGFAVTERVQLEGASDGDRERCDGTIPWGYRLARIDAELFPRTNWREMVLGIFGSAESYVEHHYGFCLLHRGELVAEAHGVVGGDLVELGMFTHPDHRRRGLTRLVLNELIEHGARLGHRTVATCAAGKIESERALARAGLRRTLAYRVLTLAR